MTNEVKEAFDILKKAMVDEGAKPGSYADSWHCNLAMVFSDTLRDSDIVDEYCVDRIQEVCNEAATRFMKLCFDVRTA